MALALALTGLGGLVVPVQSGPIRYTNVVYTRSSAYNARPEQQPTYENLNDENSATGVTTNNDSEAWIMADLGSDLPISKIRVGGGFFPTDWGFVAFYLNGVRVQTATNANPNTWQSWGTISGASNVAGSEFVDFQVVTTARYVRLFEDFNYVATTEFGIFSE